MGGALILVGFSRLSAPSYSDSRGSQSSLRIISTDLADTTGFELSQQSLRPFDIAWSSQQTSEFTDRRIATEQPIYNFTCDQDITTWLQRGWTKHYASPGAHATYLKRVFNRNRNNFVLQTIFATGQVAMFLGKIVVTGFCHSSGRFANWNFRLPSLKSAVLRRAHLSPLKWRVAVGSQCQRRIDHTEPVSVAYSVWCSADIRLTLIRGA